MGGVITIPTGTTTIDPGIIPITHISRLTLNLQIRIQTQIRMPLQTLVTQPPLVGMVERIVNN